MPPKWLVLAFRSFKKSNFGRGSAPDPAEGAYDAPPDPIVGCGWKFKYPLPISFPLDAFGVSLSTPLASTLGAFCSERADDPVCRQSTFQSMSPPVDACIYINSDFRMQTNGQQTVAGCFETTLKAFFALWQPRSGLVQNKTCIHVK